MKPLISYYGGKQRIVSKITPISEGIPHTVYVEPFAGGLAVFYARNKPLVSSTADYREVINDTSELLINLYRFARNNPEEFKRLINFTPYSKSDCELAYEICKNPNDYTSKEKAWAYYVNINQSFAKKLNEGWGKSVFSQNHAATWESRRQNIPAALDRLKDVHIECCDALACIKNWDSPQTLFYLDPPYPGTQQGHYEGYTIDDWQDLCNLLDVSECSYILSNYPQKIEPKSAQRKIEIESICSASGQGKVNQKSRSEKATNLGGRKRTEVLWICDRSKNARSELSSIFSAQSKTQLSLFS